MASTSERWPPLTYWAKATAVVVLTVALLALVRSVLDLLILIVISAVLAIGMEPLIERLGGWGLTRGWAVLILVATTLAAVALFAMLVIPTLVHQASGLGDDMPRYLAGWENRNDWLGNTMRANHITDQVRTFIQELPQRAGHSFGTILSLAGRLGTIAFGILTVAVLTIYFMLSLPSMRRTSLILVPSRYRRRGRAVMDTSIERIGGYVVGNLVTSVVCGMAALVALLVMGVPFAVPLALWAGLADLIPAVGAFLGAAPAILVAFVESPVRGVLVLVYFIAYQQFENYVLVPRVMKNAVNLSPAAVIIATLIGGSLAGLAGALLALPVAASIKVLLVEVWLRDRMAKGDRLAGERVKEERESA
jgi:predicted PurR-regulated permease PerM